MRKFMIGMHGKFDIRKFHRDFRKGFYGIEVCLFKDKKDIEKLVSATEENEFKFGIRFPALPSLKVDDGWAPI